MALAARLVRSIEASKTGVVLTRSARVRPPTVMLLDDSNWLR